MKCIKVVGKPEIYEVREETMEKRWFRAWEDYVAAGRPVYEEVSQEEADRYTTVEQFSEPKPKTTRRKSTRSKSAKKES